ncbi:MAG: putative porin [Psychroflexus sp.]
MRLFSIFIFVFLVAISAPAQDLKIDKRSRTNTDRNNNDERGETMKSVKDDRKKPHISKYKIISIENDTTVVDTTLNIHKDYKYNYLRKDDFELLPFSNIGRPYNRLAYDFDNLAALPKFGARARHFNFMEVDDIHYYEVPTPFTELYFKTVLEQGQNIDALFTTNMKPNLNISIAYKGLRSLGVYQNDLTSTGNLRLGLNYRTPNDRYYVRSHFVAQDLMNNENGGLTTRSVQQFIDQIEEIDNRAAADVQFQDAENLLDAKRFYINQFYKIRKGNDSTQNGQIRLKHVMDFTDKEYSFNQSEASPVLGPTFENSNLSDEVEYQNVSNTFTLSYFQNHLGKIGFKAGHSNINYGYRSIVISENGSIPNRIKTDILSLGGTYHKTIKDFSIAGDVTYNISGDFDGYNIQGEASYKPSDSLEISAGIQLNSSAPNYNFILNQSDYQNYNWYNPNFDNVNTQVLNFKAESKKFGWVKASLTQIDNHAYFGFTNDDQNSEMDSLVKPFQASDQVRYLKIKAGKDFKYGHLNLANTVMYQNVMNGENIFPVPDFVTRNSLFYDNYLFKKALYLQTGFTFNYFTEFQSKAYDPVLAEFAIQDREMLDGFYTVDFFLNAKVQEARIFFKLQHVNSLFEGNNNFSAPSYPYRDFVIRFGLVWNFFL